MSFLIELWFVHSFGGLAAVLLTPPAHLLLYTAPRLGAPMVQQAKFPNPLPSVYRGTERLLCAPTPRRHRAHGCPLRTVVEAGRGGR